MEKRKTKFKVECEIEVEYNISEENDMATTPYTYISGVVNEGKATLKIKPGKIVDIEMKNLERLGDNK